VSLQELHSAPGRCTVLKQTGMSKIVEMVYTCSTCFFFLPACITDQAPPWCRIALAAASWQAGSSRQALQLQTQLQAGHDNDQASPVHGGDTPALTSDLNTKT